MIIINASYSNVSVTYTADGTQTVFSFPFDYLRKAFVYVEINKETLLEQGEDYSVVEKTVVFATTPVAGTIIRIYRLTNTTPLVSWADASVLKAKDMNIQQLQVLHTMEEYRDWFELNKDIIVESVMAAEKAAKEAKEYADKAYRITPEALKWMENFTVINGKFYQIRNT